MKIDIITIFPEAFSYFETSLIKKATEKDIVSISIIDLREFSKDKHKKVDSRPYGGGAGMLISPEPVFNAVKSIKKKTSKIILTSPSGQPFKQKTAQLLAKETHLIFICGFYEGIDFRINEILVDMEISIGDYILTNGNLAAMVISDAIIRLKKKVLGNELSAKEESFSENLLEAPQYTRPEIFQGLKVPKVLLSGNHHLIDKWQKKQALARTKALRPDLIKKEKNE